MATRAQMIAHKIATWAAQSPQGALTAVLVISPLVLLCVSGALLALLSGPIGIEMLDEIPGYALTRLALLQWSASVGVVALGVMIIFVACWKEAPQFVKALYFSSVAHRVTRHWEAGLSEGSAIRFWIAVGLVGIWVNFEMLAKIPVISCLEPDTVGYLQPSAIRSSGYMFFIDAVVLLTGDMRWLYPVQLNVMLLGFAVFGFAVRRVSASLGAGLIVAIVPMISSGLLILAPAVMSEAVFAALISFHLACVLWALHRPTWLALFGVGLTLGLMIVVRPNGISFVVTVLVLAWVLRHSWRRVVVALGIPLVATIGAQGLYHQHNFGFFGIHKFGAISLVGNYAPLIRADMGSAYPELAADLEQDLAHYSRDFPPFVERSYPFEMAKVAEYTTVGAIYRIVLPAIRKRLNLDEPEAVAFEYDPRITQIAGNLAISAVMNDPWGSFKIVSSNFLSAWDKTLPIRVPISIYFPRCGRMNKEIYTQHTDLITEAGGSDIFTNTTLRTNLNIIGEGGLRLIEWPRLFLGAFQQTLAYLGLVKCA